LYERTGGGETNGDKADEGKEWGANVGERREGNKSTIGMREKKKQDCGEDTKCLSFNFFGPFFSIIKIKLNKKWRITENNWRLGCCATQSGRN
jgi:hypothetical protein